MEFTYNGRQYRTKRSCSNVVISNDTRPHTLLRVFFIGNSNENNLRITEVSLQPYEKFLSATNLARLHQAVLAEEII